MNKKEFMLVSIVIIIIFLSFIGYRYINISYQLKNQLYAEVKLLIDEARDRYRYVSEGRYKSVIIQDDLRPANKSQE
ncbi:hypothetical protein Y919_12010 [Caloranaerobacter azorensis H53214]|uniref:Uncharacterized protein n=1 Tax=Caloranaerobacter azorensis H53214 TaxID=1156417 RepID=A0A096BE65_9FIRM|nr:hypothetical protein [Caloranaerobacter azorensis]KGG79450.1 hypothetical protein Y919_12010 [Caloranaerobacter azorensis H53214]